MKDAELRREYHRLCRKRPGTLIDTEACFRAFKAGVESRDMNEPLADRLQAALTTQIDMESYDG